MNESPAPARLPIATDSLSAELDGLLRAAGRRRRLMKQEALYGRGAKPDAIYCIESGAIQLSTSSRMGRESVLGVVEPGRWFGELTLLIDAPRTHDAKALMETDLLTVSLDSVQAVVFHHPAHLLELLRLVCRRYKWAIERMDASVLQPLPVRLAHLLMAQAQAFSQQQAPQPLELKLSQESLGQMLGASRQSINRQLKLWESEGVLRITYGRITLLDPDFFMRMQ